jgi:anthranilate phosphoribosyltransferase
MPNEVKKFINTISNNQNLSEADSTRLFQIIMNGGATPAQIAATLIGLKTKGETIDEITGAVKLMP